MAIIAPDVAPEPARASRTSTQAPIEAFGGGSRLEQIGQEGQKIASDIGELATFEKARADQAAVQEAVGSQLSPAVTKMIYDPQDGALAKINQTTSMKDALKVHDDTIKQYNDFAKKTASGLSGEFQIGAFNRHAYQMGDNLNKAIMAHVDQHGKKLYQDSFDSFVNNTTAQAALGWGQLIRDPKQQAVNERMLQTHIDSFIASSGQGPDQKEELESKTFSNYHSAIVERMLADGQYKTANDYFKEHKGDIADLKIRENVEKSIETVPLQKAERAKREQELAQEQNERSLFTKAFKGELFPNDPIKSFQDNQITVNGFKTIDALVHDKDYLVGGYKAGYKTDPGTFNSIRQDQITGNKPQLQITYDIAQAKMKGKLDPNDAKYLDSQTNQMKPDDQNKDFNAAVSDIRHFAQNFYVPEHRFLSSFIGDSDEAKAKASSEVEHVVKDFTMNADRQRLSGESLQEFTTNTKKALMKSRFPGLPEGDAPSVVVTAKGQVLNALNPGHKSTLKARYKIVPIEQSKKSQ